MEFVIYLFPFLVSVILLIFFKKKTVWWEYLILIVPSLLFTIGTKEIMIKSRTTDTEYYGGYVVKVRHYDDWDEWIKRTCTRQVPVGKDSEGNTIYEEEEYDCSYRQYHPETWTFTSSLSEYEHYINKDLFEEIKRKFNTQMVFVDMHRDYYRKDGDAQDYYWTGTRNTIYTITEDHTYTNKVKASTSIFNFEKISRKEASELDLYDYPEIYKLDQNPVLRRNNMFIRKDEVEALQYVNGYYGRSKQLRTFILLFDASEGIEKAYKQQAYWEGGNKNELIVCFGLKGRTVEWCYAFSWEDSQKMAINTMNQYRNNEKLDIVEYSNWLIENIDNWKRKEFADFDYIRITLTKGQFIGLFIIVLLLNIGLSFYIIGNEYENED